MDVVKILKIIFIAVAVLYIAIFILTAVFQEKLLFVPQQLPQEYEFRFPTKFEEFFLDGKDGKSKLNALHFSVENPKGVVLYYHGNAGQLADWGFVVQDYVHRGYDVIVMDYRGYGKSTGDLSEKALYEDAELFYEYTANRYDENKIIVYGRSLGTTFATYVASKNNPSKLMLEAPFYDMKSLAQEKFPIFPVSWVMRYSFPTYKYIAKVSCPIYIFHGTADEMVPIKNSEKLSEIIPKQQLHFISIADGTHNDLVKEADFIKAIDTIF